MGGAAGLGGSFGSALVRPARWVGRGARPEGPGWETGGKAGETVFQHG